LLAVKGNYKLPGKRYEDFVPYPRLSHHERRHLHEKPIGLMVHLMRAVCPGPGAMILDPFMGTGATLAAAKILGNDCVGIELDPLTFEIAEQTVASVNTIQNLI